MAGGGRNRWRNCRNARRDECSERHQWYQTEALGIKTSLPVGVEVVAGYDRSGLIQTSIQTLQRDLLEEAVIVSLVIIVFLFHFRSALIPILTLPIAVVASFIRCITSTSVRTLCRWADWPSPLVCSWMPPSSWLKTVTGIYPSVSQRRFPVFLTMQPLVRS